VVLQDTERNIILSQMIRHSIEAAAAVVSKKLIWLGGNYTFSHSFLGLSESIASRCPGSFRAILVGIIDRGQDKRRFRTWCFPFDSRTKFCCDFG
jgi:hypothetical protein